MDDEEETRRKLTSRERKIIDNIMRKAEKRPHKKIYTVKFLIDSLFAHDTIKEWSYECRQDVLDMIDALIEIALKMKYMTPKQAVKERRAMIKEYADVYFPPEDDDDIIEVEEEDN
jgi:hypothetical protein